MLSKEYQSGPNVVYYVYWRRSRNGETNLEFQSVCLINIFIIKIIQINARESITSKKWHVFISKLQSIRLFDSH